MSDLELRISRYLDGEMSPEEEADLRPQLEVSPEARALLREMTLLKRAARRIPATDLPRRSVEAKLFGQLRAEGLYAGLEEAPAPPAPAYADRAPRRRMPVRGVVTTLTLLFLAIVMGDQLRTPESADVATPVAQAPTEQAPTAQPPAASVAPERQASSPAGSLAAAAPALDARPVETAAQLAAAAPVGRTRTALSRGASSSGALARMALPEGMPEGRIASLEGRGGGAAALDGGLAPQSSAKHEMSVMAFKAAPVDGGIGSDGAGSGVDIESNQAATAPPAAPMPSEAMSLRSALRSGHADASIAPTPGRDQTDRESAVRIHSASRDAGNLFAASVRPGVSYIGKGGGMMAQEMSFRFDASLSEHHQLSLIAGRAPTVSQTRTDRTLLPDAPQAMSSTDRTDTRLSNGGFQETGAGPTAAVDMLPASATPQPQFTSSSAVSMKNEVWFGVGYTYSFAPVKAVRVGAGAKAGGSPTSWRLGLELPVRYHVAPNVAIEAVPSATFVSPYDHAASAYTADESVDGYSYRGESQRLSFTSIGLEVGLRIEFGR